MTLNSAREAMKRRLRPFLGHWRWADRRFLRAWPSIDPVDGWLTKLEAELLFALARDVPAGHAIVEIGSYKGRSTLTFSAGAGSGVPIFAVDPHTGDRTQVERGEVVDTWAEFRANLASAGTQSVVPVRAPSVEAAKSYRGPEIGLLFIDGWHSTEAVLADWESWRPFLSTAPTIVFDDWNHPEVRIAIDSLLPHLPGRVGAVGKDEVFADRVPRRVRRLCRYRPGS